MLDARETVIGLLPAAGRGRRVAGLGWRKELFPLGWAHDLAGGVLVLATAAAPHAAAYCIHNQVDDRTILVEQVAHRDPLRDERRLNATIETVFMMPAEQYTYISSRLIKEVFALGGRVHGFVPDVVEARLRDKVSAVIK